MSAYDDNVRRANETFEPGDLVDMSKNGLASVVLLLSSPDGAWPIRAIFFDEDDGADAATSFIFENRLPADFLGRDGRLLWRAGAKIAR